jgi:hypothetical protein
VNYPEIQEDTPTILVVNLKIPTFRTRLGFYRRRTMKGCPRMFNGDSTFLIK